MPLCRFANYESSNLERKKENGLLCSQKYYTQMEIHIPYACFVAILLYEQKVLLKQTSKPTINIRITRYDLLTFPLNEKKNMQ